MKKLILPIIIIAVVAFFYPDISLNIAHRIRAIISIYSIILLITLLTLGLFISISLYIRYKRKKRQVKYLFKKLRIDKESILKLNQESINRLYKESVAKLRNNKFTIEVGTTSVAVFDVLYTLSKVDPFVLSGINHLHHDQNFESMGDLTGYLTENIITSSKGTEAWVDMIHKYKGYTGEEVIFDRIGFENITVPESAVNEGYDFIDNLTGQKYDIKVWSSTDRIKQELNNLPEDVKLWVNKEHAAEFSNHPRVYVDQNLSESDIFELTDNTFNSVDSMSDLINSSIPFATLAISSFKNYKLVKSGSKNKKIATQDILLDTAGVGIGSMIGYSIGTRLSQYLTPITDPWSFVIIPISATLGNFIGIITGKGIVNWYKERHIRKAQNEIESSLIEFEKTYRKRYRLIINDKKNKTKTDGNKYIYLKKNNQNIISRYFWPNTFTTFCEIAFKKIFDEFQNFRDYYFNLKQEMIKSYKKEERGLFLYSQGRDPFTIDSKLCDIWDSIENKISLLKIEIEKKK